MKRSVIALFTVLALLAGAANARATNYAVPTQKIVGADETIPAGELVVLAPSTIANAPKELVKVAYDWTILDDGKVKKRVRREADGSVTFGAGIKTKTLVAILNVVYLFETKDTKGNVTDTEIVIRSITAEVHIAGIGPDPHPPTPPGPGPTPPPPPGPTPPPAPNFPDGKYKLSKTAYDTVLAKVALPAKERSSACLAVATSFRGIASSISAGAFKDPAVILKTTKDANNRALKSVGVDPAAFDSFGVVLQKTLFQLYDNGKLTTPDDFATAWNEIAGGLQAFASAGAALPRRPPVVIEERPN